MQPPTESTAFPGVRPLFANWPYRSEFIRAKGGLAPPLHTHTCQHDNFSHFCRDYIAPGATVKTKFAENFMSRLHDLPQLLITPERNAGAKRRRTNGALHPLAGEAKTPTRGRQVGTARKPARARRSRVECERLWGGSQLCLARKSVNTALNFPGCSIGVA